MNQMLNERNLWHYWMMVRPNKRKKPKIWRKPETWIKLNVDASFIQDEKRLGICSK
jgi:hypothetical protein